MIEPLSAGLSHRSLELIEMLGGVSRLAWLSLRRLPYLWRRVPLLAEQIVALGIHSLSISTVTAVFTGMVLTVQFAFGLKRFGAAPYVGQVVSLSLVRELAPVLTALMVGGRIASGMAAEIGSMKVTEQLDAMRVLGTDPIRKLVVPRVVASTLIMPLLTGMGILLGVLGGMFVAQLELGITYRFFYQSCLDAVVFQDLFSGLGKSAFFGFFIGVVACYMGVSTQGGTEGVGRSTTRAVVTASIIVLISDFFLTKIFIIL